MKLKSIILLSLIFIVLPTMIYANDTITSAINTLINSDSTLNQVSQLIDKPVTKNPVEMITYILILISTILIKFLPSISKIAILLNKSNNILIKRWLSETSTFMKKVGAISLTIAGILIIIAEVVPDSIKAIIQTMYVICITLGGFTLFTSNSPDLTK